MWTAATPQHREEHRIPTQSVPIINGKTSVYARPRLHLAHERFTYLENAHLHTNDAPLLTRAWAFQERNLPPKTLHIHSEELVWECRTSMRCECGELDDPYLRKAEANQADSLECPAHINSPGWLKSLFATIKSADTPHRSLPHIWMDLVSEFARLDLTYESDRLPALSGLAAKFEGRSMGRYLAGIWTASFPAGLLFESLWSRPSFVQHSNHQPQAPSWSWASIPLSRTVGISYNRILRASFTPDPDFEFKALEREVIGKSPYG